MKVKLSLRQVVDLWTAAKNVGQVKTSPIKWAYAVAKNRSKVQPEVDGVGSIEQRLLDADKERLELCREHAKKDAQGEPIMFQGPDGVSRFLGVSENLPELREILRKIEAIKKEHADFLKTEVEVELHMVDFAEVPKEIAPDDLGSLLVMVTGAPECK